MTDHDKSADTLYDPEGPSRYYSTLGAHFDQHIEAMTVEGLHAKFDIASELAWRDQQIERLRAALLTVLGDATHGQGMDWSQRIEQARAALAGENDDR